MKQHLRQSKSSYVGLSRRAAGVLLAAIALLSFTADAVEKARQRGGAQAAAALADPDQPRAEYVPGEILVGFNPGARGQADQVRQAHGAQKINEWPAIQAHHWRLPPGLDVAKAVQILSANPNVAYAEPNYLYQAAAFPSDPPNDAYRGELWGLHNVGQSGGTVGADISALAAWHQQLGSPSIVVAVIDSGIDYTHPELSANIWINPGEIPGNGIDDDGNGYVDDVMGWDFVNNDNDPMDDNSHGTHVAGTIGAIGNNGAGVIGVSPVVRLMPLKFLNAGGSGSTDNAIKAILYAASFKDVNGNPIVRISNNSWGGGSKSRTLENAIKSCGALFCAAAGNGASSSVSYPAGYAQPNIVAVAATDDKDTLASFSNFGSWVHLAAPGVNILSSIPGNAFDIYSGTSMATPHVAGALALLRAQFPSLNNTDLRNRLLGNVDVKTTLSGKVTSGGRLNVAKALGAAPLPADSVAPSAVTDLTVAQGPTETNLTLRWTATGDDGSVGQAYLYDLRYSTTPITSDTWSDAISVRPEPSSQAPGSTEYLIMNDLRPETHYYFGLRVIDERANASALSLFEVTTLRGAWSLEVVDSAAGDYNSLAYNAGGQPVIAYNSGAHIRLATRNGTSWSAETVAAGRSAVSLAYNPSGAPALSWVGNSVSGKPITVLYFAEKIGSTWSTVMVDSAEVQGSTTSLAYNAAGVPFICYRVLSGVNAGLRLAWRSGNTWKTQTVRAKAGARYSSLALAPSGNPVIAYSDDLNGDNSLETLSLAEGTSIGSSYSWVITTLETGTAGYGVFANLAFDPTGNPVITHGNGTARLVQKINGNWFSEVVDGSWGTFMTVDKFGNIHLGYDAGFLKAATRPANGSAPWSFTYVDLDAFLGWPGSIRVASDGLPAISYAGYDQWLGRVGLQFAKKNPGF